MWPFKDRNFNGEAFSFYCWGSRQDFWGFFISGYYFSSGRYSVQPGKNPCARGKGLRSERNLSQSLISLRCSTKRESLTTNSQREQYDALSVRRETPVSPVRMFSGLSAYTCAVGDTAAAVSSCLSSGVGVSTSSRRSAFSSAASLLGSS